MKLDGKSTAELVQMREAICADPKNKVTGGLFLYTKEARKKLDRIDRAITENIRQKRLAEGKPVNDSGYSGRQTNKR